MGRSASRFAAVVGATVRSVLLLGVLAAPEPHTPPPRGRPFDGHDPRLRRCYQHTRQREIEQRIAAFSALAAGPAQTS